MTHEKSRFWVLVAMSAVFLAGCQRPLELHFPEVKPVAVYRDVVPGKTHDTGRLTGVVQWSGMKPVVEPIRGLIDTKDGAAWGEVENPFVPEITRDNEVNGVVIQVLNPPAEITQEWLHEDNLRIILFGWKTLHPTMTKSILFTKVGREEVFSRQGQYSQIRARGASFFTRTFMSDETEHRVRFDQPGLVEFTDTGGKFWCYKRMWVCDHPYFASSDFDGSFDLGKLPSGEYDIQASIPDWRITGRDRDPETGRVMRLHRGPDITTVQRVKIEAGKETKIMLKLSSPTVPPPADQQAP